MKIAILAWGSLIWDQRELSIVGGWHMDNAHADVGGVGAAPQVEDRRRTPEIVGCGKMIELATSEQSTSLDRRWLTP